jgi:hypothetical protein
MTEHRGRLTCPLCEGQGEVRHSQLIEFFSDPQLKTKINAYLSNVTPAGDETAELVGAAVREPRNFQKEVHSWNPEVPMWQRSPKE